MIWTMMLHIIINVYVIPVYNNMDLEDFKSMKFDEKFISNFVGGHLESERAINGAKISLNFRFLLLHSESYLFRSMHFNRLEYNLELF